MYIYTLLLIETLQCDVKDILMIYIYIYMYVCMYVCVCMYVWQI